MKNLIDRIIAFEDGEFNDDQTVEFFQELINDGTAWTLQGNYGRLANSLIESGYCTNNQKVIS